jgi:hypothetical protein
MASPSARKGSRVAAGQRTAGGDQALRQGRRQRRDGGGPHRRCGAARPPWEARRDDLLNKPAESPLIHFGVGVQGGSRSRRLGTLHVTVAGLIESISPLSGGTQTELQTMTHLKTPVEPSSAASTGADTSPSASCSAAARSSTFEASRTQPAGCGAAQKFSNQSKVGR